MSSSYDEKKKEFEFREAEILCKNEQLDKEWRLLYEEQQKFELEYMKREGSLPLHIIKDLRENLQTVGRIIHSENCTATIRLMDEEPTNEYSEYEIQISGTFGGNHSQTHLHYDIHIRTVNTQIQKIIRTMLYTTSDLKQRERERGREKEKASGIEQTEKKTVWRKDNEERSEILVLDY